MRGRRILQGLGTDNRRYRVDIDTPEDLLHFIRELRWPAALTAV